ncbi:MAG: LytTR family DNA-binding domain-containing protein [Polaribacter sp.]
MEEIIKTLIVEDDSVSTKLLKLLLKKYCPEIEIVGTAKNADNFIRLYFEKQPSLIFLDIHLEGRENSLSILNEIQNLDAEVVITSADAQHVLDAINDHQVAGYILKPVGVFDLKKVIVTAARNIHIKRAARNSIAGLSEKLIAISTPKMIEFLMVRDIVYLEAEGKYTLFHLTNGEAKMVSKNIGEYEKILPQQVFYRIHHKYIVNLQKVHNINKSEGSYCHLINGISLTIAKRRHELLRKFLSI